MFRSADETVLHERLTQHVPMYSPDSLLSFWNANQADPRHELRPGTVLRAKDADESDPWRYIRVVSVYETTKDHIEYGCQQLFAFSEVVSAPARGPGGILEHYDWMPSSEVRALLDSRRPAETEDADQPGVDVAAARRQLDAARAEQEGR